MEFSSLTTLAGSFPSVFASGDHLIRVLFSTTKLPIAADLKEL